ncbi:nuclear apoptosis-inducing factor 1 [Bombina bombina]|uniref:nuclear apoptosis-inducing factor 1 n=1 Tax=Bombina bombina TaxID=8345 RepID=UPI00235A82BD|nr:nuclear apoptosis-inducing factor 1 [Bombina bombina]
MDAQGHKATDNIRGRIRVLKFREEETEILVNGILDNYSKLFGSLCNMTTTSEKSRIWKKILRDINALGYARRTTDILKKKWVEIKRKLKRKMAELARESRRGAKRVTTDFLLTGYEKRLSDVLSSCPQELDQSGIIDTRDQRGQPGPSHTLAGDGSSQDFSSDDDRDLLMNDDDFMADFTEAISEPPSPPQPETTPQPTSVAPELSSGARVLKPCVPSPAAQSEECGGAPPPCYQQQVLRMHRTGYRSLANNLRLLINENRQQHKETMAMNRHTVSVINDAASQITDAINSLTAALQQAVEAVRPNLLISTPVLSSNSNSLNISASSSIDSSPPLSHEGTRRSYHSERDGLRPGKRRRF